MDENQAVVLLTEVTSCEFHKNDQAKPVLDHISLHLHEGEVLGISSKDRLETELLCRIIGNILPYYSGRCVLNRIGMMQNKRVVLEHLYYIDSPSMLYDNMNVLEYLMFATSKSSSHLAFKRQKGIFEFLLQIGLDYISLSLISNLTNEERMAIQFLLAAYSNSQIIVLDASGYEFSDSLISTLKQICDKCRETGKTVVMGTMQAKLIGICCCVTTFIVDGRQRYFGSVEELYAKADRVLYVLFHERPEEMLNKLVVAMPEYEYKFNGRMLFVMRKGNVQRNDALFFDSLSKFNIFPDSVKINRGRVQNSFEELMEINDLQE